MKLTISQLSKQYRRDFWGLRDFDLELSSGVIGLLGPNGAGKSTLMRMLATITRPSAGTVTWNGSDIVKFPNTLRAVLGYLPQDFGIYPNLTGLEFLEYMAAIKGLDAKSARRRIDELLTLVNLVHAAKRPLGGYSGGMKQRVGIAQALLNDPQLLIVDEPTVGLDPEERVRFRNLLSDLSANVSSCSPRTSSRMWKPLLQKLSLSIRDENSSTIHPKNCCDCSKGRFGSGSFHRLSYQPSSKSISSAEPYAVKTVSRCGW